MSKLSIFYPRRIMQCTYIKPDGSQCWANAMENSDFCWFHAPEVDYERRDSNSKGGKAHRTGIYRDLPSIPLKTIKDVPELLMDTVRQLRAGFIGPRIAATLGYLSGMLIKSFEVSCMDTRLKKLEDTVEKILKVPCEPAITTGNIKKKSNK
jgi:hypothetical protein